MSQYLQCKVSFDGITLYVPLKMLEKNNIWNDKNVQCSWLCIAIVQLKESIIQFHNVHTEMIITGLKCSV